MTLAGTGAMEATVGALGAVPVLVTVTVTVGDGLTLAVGDALALGSGVGVGVLLRVGATASGVGVLVAVALGTADGVELGQAVPVGLGDGVGVLVAVALGVALAALVALALPVGVGEAVGQVDPGAGAGSAAVSVRASAVAPMPAQIAADAACVRMSVTPQFTHQRERFDILPTPEGGGFSSHKQQQEIHGSLAARCFGLPVQLRHALPQC